MKVRLRIIDDKVLKRNPDKFFVCVAKDRVDPDFDTTPPQIRAAQLEQWDEFKGAWLPIEIES